MAQLPSLDLFSGETYPTPRKYFISRKIRGAQRTVSCKEIYRSLILIHIPANT